MKRSSSLESLLQPWTAAVSGVRRRLAATRERRARPAAAAPAAAAAAQPAELRASRLAAGSAMFASLIFLAAAYPFALPHAFLAFLAVALPYRIYHFTIITPHNAFFLGDFCYSINLAVAAFLLAPPRRQDPRLAAALYVLAEGPVAAALSAWQCAWVFSSAEHTVSVLIHLLPGLAMYAHRHLPRLTSWAQLAGCAPRLGAAATALQFAGCVADAAPAPLAPALPLDRPALWLLAAPMAFFAAWQALYFLVVQVACGPLIRRRRLDTSYRCLARRAARADNALARLVLRGSTARRLALYAALQAAFTVAALLAAAPTYYSWHAAFVW
jgi:hypothetical protein